MKLLEYKAKELLAKFDIPVQPGFVIESSSEIEKKIHELNSPFVLKVQIPAGGRGKAGGIKFADNAYEAKVVAESLIGSCIRGCKVGKLLIATKTGVLSEWYLSIIIDRLHKCPAVIFSSQGGVDIEETAGKNPERIIKVCINPLLEVKDYHARYIFDVCSLDYTYFDPFLKILSGLYSLFKRYDATLVEINPLAVTDTENLLALDCKIDIDDSALYRQPEILEFRDLLDEDPLVVEARSYGFLYIPLNTEGNIAVVSNGSGMLMSCIDLLSSAGFTAGAALDLGGGATSERIAKAIKIIFKNKKTEVAFISIFGGITRCDEVAEGVRLAVEDDLKDKKVIIRLEGTNKAEAVDIIKKIQGNILHVDTILKGVKTLSSGGQN